MSPNEAQLRAALRHGEGDSPDAGALISHAMRVRRDRQRKRTSILTGTGVVAVIATGVGLLISLGSGSEGAGSSGGNAAAPALRSQPSAPAAAGGASTNTRGRAGSAETAPRTFGADAKAPARAVRLVCPSEPARYAVPGGGGIGAFGSGEKLFARSVSAMKICAYPGTPIQHPASTVLTATSAERFATTLETAPTAVTQPRSPCPTNTAPGAELVVLPVSGDAQLLKPVVITAGPCSTSKATNGTAVRYVARLPRPVAGLLRPSHEIRPRPTQPARASGTG